MRVSLRVVYGTTSFSGFCMLIIVPQSLVNVELFDRLHVICQRGFDNVFIVSDEQANGILFGHLEGGEHSHFGSYQPWHAQAGQTSTATDAPGCWTWAGDVLQGGHGEDAAVAAAPAYEAGDCKAEVDQPQEERDEEGGPGGEQAQEAEVCHYDLCRDDGPSEGGGPSNASSAKSLQHRRPVHAPRGDAWADSMEGDSELDAEAAASTFPSGAPDSDYTAEEDEATAEPPATTGLLKLSYKVLTPAELKDKKRQRRQR